MYKAIDRKTQNFHVMYEPEGPTIINLLDGDRELFYFYNHNAQTEFLSAIECRKLSGGLSDEILDAECRALLARQWKSKQRSEPKMLEYKQPKPKLIERLAIRNKISTIERLAILLKETGVRVLAS